MTFAQIPANAFVFIDASIFVYHFTPHPLFGPECQSLMDRISKYQDVTAVTSTHVMSEMAHQLTVLEAVATMQDQAIIHLASADTDFDRVPGMTRYGPV